MNDSTITTSTGWRIKGSAETVQAIGAAHLSPPGHVDWGAHLKLKSRSSRSPATEVLAGVSAALTEQMGRDIVLELDTPLELDVDKYTGLRWEPVPAGTARGGELLYRFAHPLRRGVPCTARVILVEFSARTSMTIAIGTDDGALAPGVDTHALRPPWLNDLLVRVTAVYEGRIVDAHPLHPGDIRWFVDRTLLSADRRVPVVVVTPREDGTFVIPPVQLARELVGQAHVYFMPEHTTSFVLTDTLEDKRWSAFWGAVRIYLPGLSLNDDPSDHPLLLPDRLEDAYVRATVLGRLPSPDLQLPEDEVTEGPGEESGDPGPRSTTDPQRGAAGPGSPITITAPTATATPAPTPTATPAPTPTATPGSTPTPTINVTLDHEAAAEIVRGLLSEQLAAVRRRMDQINETMATVADEVEQLHSLVQINGTGASALDRKLDRLITFVRQALPSTEVEVDLSAHAASEEQELSALADVVSRAQQEQLESLLVLDSAIAAAQKSPYEDHETVELVLGVMARVSARRVEGKLGTSLRDAFKEFGLNYASAIPTATSARLREQYQFTDEGGQVHECHEHIRLGSTYDPRYCLRIYFTSKASGESRFVIGHVGRHFEVKTTT